MSSASFHESDLMQAVRLLNPETVKLLGYRDFVAYISSLGVPLMKLDDFDTMVYINGGSYTSTYRTLHKGSTKPVAFKTPLNSLSRADQQLEREAHHRALSGIIQEIRILAHSSLSVHPNLPGILGVSIVEDSQQDGISPCIVQELAFMDLEHFLSPDGAIPKLDTLRIILDIADGICALHAYRLVHGDIHPKNILLFQDQGSLVAKVADLGTCGAELASEFIPGTRDFWAPECHPRSPFHNAHMNGLARDVYTFGLLINHLISGSYQNTPFPQNQQFQIQHDDNRTLQQLAKRRVSGPINHIIDDAAADIVYAQLVALVLRTVRVDPRDRPTISTLCRELRSIFHADDIQEVAEETVQKNLISDPEDPRIRIVSQLPLPPGVISRLTSEYRVESRETRDPKIALYMATLYRGSIGSGLENPWNVVAKTQWLFKAVELGSYPSLTPLMGDEDVVGIIKEFGKKALFFQHPTFEPPSIDLPELIRQLKMFAAMPDKAALELLTYLGEAPSISQDETSGVDDRTQGGQKRRVGSFLSGLSLLERFTLNRKFDAGSFDCDAYDVAMLRSKEFVTAESDEVVMLGKKNIVRLSAYNDALESFIAAMSALGYTRKDGNMYMQLAIFGGARSVVEYLSRNYEVGGDEEHDGISHVELSILFMRLDILSFFLRTGATVRAAAGNRPSGLHLASRHDSREMIYMLCEHLQTTGSLQSVLNSSTSSGAIAHWTPTYIAMVSHAYTNLMAFLDFGANPETACENGGRLIHQAVLPKCPATPMFVLTRLIEASADLNAANNQHQVPLHTAIGSTNILAVYHLLTAGADCNLLSDAGETASEAAEDISRSMETEGQIDVFNEEGELCESGHDHCFSASKYIATMVAIASTRSDGWKETLRRVLETIESHLKNKIWIVDRIPITAYLQIEIPD